MVKIGEINRLRVNRKVDFGVYLQGDGDTEILMPAKYVTEPLAEGDETDVFVYNDSEDRIIATTETPRIKVGEFAYLRVSQVNRYGAFLDWGITAKDLLVPYREQKSEMRQDGVYLVYAYLDHATMRIVGSSKIDKFLGNVIPRYNKGDKVGILVYERTPIGYRCIVDNLHKGMIYDNEIYTEVHPGDKLEAYVKNIREDYRIDLMLGDRADRRTDSLAQQVIDRVREAGGFLPISDKSSPAEIQREFAASKRDFKKAIGHLYKDRRIIIKDQGIYLASGELPSKIKAR